MAKLTENLRDCLDIMVKLQDARPSAKKARTDGTSVNIHAAEASASAEQQTNDAAGPSQQQRASEIFGASLPYTLVSYFSLALRNLLTVLCSVGAGMQGPAGVSTSFAPVEDESKALGDFEPGAIERPEGIVSPEGAVCGLVFALCR